MSRVSYTDRKLLAEQKATTANHTSQDASGLGVGFRAGKKGVAVHFFARPSLDGKQHFIPIGKWPKMSLADARKKYIEIMDKFERGEVWEAPAPKPKVPTVGEVWETMMNAKLAAGLKSSSIKAYNTFANKFRYTFSMPVTAITSAWAMENLVQPLTAEKKLTQLKRELYIFRVILDHSVALELIPANPLDKLAKILPKEKQRHQPTFSQDEMDAQITELFTKTCEYNHGYTAWLLLYFLTLLRARELTSIKVDELRADHVFVKTKTYDSYKIPLTPQARAVMKWIIDHHKNPQCPYVIEGATGGHADEGTLRYMLFRLGYADKFTLHGIRALGRMWMQQQPNIKESIAELCLTHVVPGGMVQQAYNRGDYFAERMEAMTRWGQHVMELGGPALDFLKSE